jgi:Flp pilus assembly pilin Flp
MPHWLRAFAFDDHGQDLVEYAVLASFVALVTFGAVYALGVGLQNWLNAIGNRVQGMPRP